MAQKQMEGVLKKIAPSNGQHLEEKDVAKGPKNCYPRNALQGARKLTSWPSFLQRAAKRSTNLYVSEYHASQGFRGQLTMGELYILTSPLPRCSSWQKPRWQGRTLSCSQSQQGCTPN